MSAALTAAMIQGGTSLLSSLFGKKPKQAPQVAAQQMMLPQQLGAPQQVNYQSASQMPAYASLFQQQPYDQGSSPVYQQLLSQMGSGQLPPELRNQILGQALLEAQNAYGAANQNLNFDEDRAMRGASERMNKMGLLSSGAHGVTQGLIGEGYARQRGTLAANLQGQLGAASTNLMQQEFAQRQRTMELLSGIENNRQNASLTSRGQLFNMANQDAQGQNQANQFNVSNQMANDRFNTTNQMSANQFNVGQVNSTNQFNAGNQYKADQYAYTQQAASNANLFNTLGQMGAAYAGGRQRSIRRTVR